MDYTYKILNILSNWNGGTLGWFSTGMSMLHYPIYENWKLSHTYILNYNLLGTAAYND